MSKLDNIILECANKVLDGKQETLGDYIDPTKEKVKELMLELIDTAEVFGPLHPQLSIYRDSLKSEIRKL